MKKLLRNLLAFCLPLVLFSCEEGLLGPRQPNCRETEQVSNTGQATQRIFDGKRLSQIRTLNSSGQLTNYVSFTYGADNRISEAQYFNAQDNPITPPYVITYNEAGKWDKLAIAYSNGDVVTYTAAYDDQNQIQKSTYSTTRSGTTTVNYTLDYIWENGNNTLLTYVSPTQRQVVQYEFDLNQANMQRKEQEKTAFLYSAVAFNRNMLKRTTSTTTTGTTTATTVSDYNYQYNEQGYPVRLTRTGTTNSGTPTAFVTDFSYACN